jgi:two-component system, chemotaxis family, protein-glutamate methylesterase/glutaminase
MSQDFRIRCATRVLVVDDSAFMRTALSRMIGSEADFEVVGTASSGAEALKKLDSLDPDVVTLDIEMPGLNGLETLRHIMSESPRPVIMVSAATEKDAEDTFKALASGAFDYVPKQLSRASLDIFHIREDLIAKIRTAAASRRPVFNTNPIRKPPQPCQAGWSIDSTETIPAIVAFGSSTGGPKALEEILPRFPRDIPIPMLIVQHMPPGFTAAFAQRLDRLCAITVQEAVHRTPIEPGVVYIAPAGRHMKVKPFGSHMTICLDDQPADSLHIPSVDVTMTSVAERYRGLAVGVILTGMGSDGAEGMSSIHRWGGLTIGQDEATSTVYGMPKACVEMGAVRRLVPLSEIPTHILQAVHYRRRALSETR